MPNSVQAKLPYITQYLFAYKNILLVMRVQESQVSLILKKDNKLHATCQRSLNSSLGRSAPLCYMAIRGYFQFSFFRGLVLDVKGQNPKAQPSTLKIVALRIFWKIINSGKNPEMLKIRYLEIRLFIQKRPAKIKRRHIGYKYSSVNF